MKGRYSSKAVAAWINPGEAAIRQGFLHDRFPATFPTGQGSDLAGTVEELGAHVTGFAVGDEVIGFTHNRASHAEYVIVAEDQRSSTDRRASRGSRRRALRRRDHGVRGVCGAVEVERGDTVVVSGPPAEWALSSYNSPGFTPGSPSIGALASEPNHAWLAGLGAIPVTYGDGVGDRVRAAANGTIDAFIDTYGAPYVELALELGVPGERINTIIDFAGAAKHGTKAEGSAAAASADVLDELATLIADGELEIPIAETYGLHEVRDAFRELERRHTRGKIVLKP